MAKKKSRFAKKIKRNQQTKAARQGGTSYLKIPEGVKIYKAEPDSKATLDILPYIITDEKHMDIDGEELKVGEQWYTKPFKVHKNIGVNDDTIVCPTTFGLPCPICEYTKNKLKNGGDKDEVKELFAKDRHLYIVIPVNDKNNDEDEVHIWDMSFHLFQKLFDKELNDTDDESDWNFPDLEEGKSIKIRFDEKKFGKFSFAETSRIDFEERDEQYDADFIDELPNLDEVLILLSYEKIESMFMQIDAKDIEDDPHEEEEETKKVIKSKRKKKKIVKEDSEDEEIKEGEENEEEEEQEEKPKRKIRKSKKIKKVKEEPEEEETEEETEEEETEEEEEKPKRKKTINKKKKKSDEDNKCPFGHKWGVDCEKHEDCDECEEWDDCADAS